MQNTVFVVLNIEQETLAGRYQDYIKTVLRVRVLELIEVRSQKEDIRTQTTLI